MPINKGPSNKQYGIGYGIPGGPAREGIFGVGPNQLGMSDEELSKYISELLRNLGTQGEQAYNRASELTYDAPEATKLAAQRNVGYTTAMAGEKGITGLEQFQKGVNRDAWRTILDARMRKYGIDTQAEMAQTDIFDLLAGIGGGVGMGVGSKWGAKLFD